MHDVEHSATTRSPDDPIADAIALLARWNLSLAVFYVHRWQRQMELPLKLARAASPGELLDGWRAFEEDLLADYLDQSEALQHACSASGARMMREIESAYGAELLKAQEHAGQLIAQAKFQAERIVASASARADEILANATADAEPRRAANG